MRLHGSSNKSKLSSGPETAFLLPIESFSDCLMSSIRTFLPGTTSSGIFNKNGQQSFRLRSKKNLTFSYFNNGMPVEYLFKHENGRLLTIMNCADFFCTLARAGPTVSHQSLKML
ncbi:hypothetical protein AVEN_241676-1 [Araneus ventricosus]|uniref:Uncharacterized protein n=1 Tax=Araneus ventricosus TaxID=182803 RepID=A0A4Y2KDE0_ARAVE|nr:hypothetical protein AVEN_241676-1 [Araneus ventricosus]